MRAFRAPSNTASCRATSRRSCWPNTASMRPSSGARNPSRALTAGNETQRAGVERAARRADGEAQRRQRLIDRQQLVARAFSRIGTGADGRRTRQQVIVVARRIGEAHIGDGAIAPPAIGVGIAL